MPLRMKSLRIQGFKAIGDATLHWHPRVNVITGPNNSGKTTILEALALWVEGFDRMSVQAGKAIQQRRVRQGDWFLSPAQAHHSEIVSVRSPGFDDLFHRDADRLTLTAAFGDEQGDGQGEFEIAIQIRKARGGNYDFSCATESTDLNPRLNASCQKWPRPFRVLFASPVAAVLTSEEFVTPGKTFAMIRQRRSAEVLRNRIHRLSGDANEFQLFNDDVSRVLTGSRDELKLEVRGNPLDDLQAQVLANRPRDVPRDISLLGSGSLQIIEVLLNLRSDSADLRLVLLDEPDSHIHRDVQRRLLEVIEERAKQAQVFATTHNESLLRNAGWDRVFHLSPTSPESPREFRPIGSEQLVLEGRKHGLIASPLRNVLSSVGAETALDFLNALEARHFLLVEGATDAVVLDRMFEIDRLGTPRETAMYWSLNGIDSGLPSLGALKVVLGDVRNDRSLWEKARIVLDRDLLTDQHANAMVDALRNRFQIAANFWAARTVEAVLLSGGPSPALAQLLRRMGTASRLPGVADNLEAASEACAKAWQAVGERLKAAWDHPNLEALHSTLSQRLQLCERVFGRPNPLAGGIGRLQETVVTFHRQAIDSGRYHESAGKQDVADFLCDALVHMGASPADAEAWRGPNWLGVTVAEIGSISDFPALRAMREQLRQTG